MFEFELTRLPVREFADTVRWADVVDVLLASGFFFIVLSWLRRSASRGALIVTASVVAVYVLARVMNLYLVELMIRGLLVVFLLASVVVFQADLRRFMDRIGAWSRSQRGSRSGTAGPVDVLTEAAFRMGENKTGALIVLRGQEPWERHVEGGVPLGGAVSLPLLYSLFHHHSAGHDGAMLMEGATITAFGAHLPLSTELSAGSPMGTRHAAALGLAEVCDALVLVVSEERGTVSVAHDSTITTLDAPGDLKRRLEAFWEKHYADGGSARPAWWNRRVLSTAALSLGVAVLAWLLFAHQTETIYRTAEVPIEFRNLPGDRALEETVPATAQVTLAGPTQAFRLFDLPDLVVSFDLENVVSGDTTLMIDAGALNLPNNLSLYRAEPSVVPVQVQRVRAVERPVAVRTTGAVPDSLELVRLDVQPRTITFLLPAGEDAPERVYTQPVDLRGATGGSFETQLALPSEARLPSGQSMTVTVRPQLRRRAAAPASE